MGCDGGEGLTPVGCGDDVETGKAQGGGEQFTNIGLIIHYEETSFRSG